MQKKKKSFDRILHPFMVKNSQRQTMNRRKLPLCGKEHLGKNLKPKSYLLWDNELFPYLRWGRK